MANGNDTKLTRVNIPTSYMASNKLASTDYVVDLAKHPKPAELAAFLIGYGFRVIVQRATAGVKDTDVAGARKAISTRVEALYSEDFGAGSGGPRVEPVFGHARAFIAKALKLKPSEIPDWDWITAKVGAEKAEKIRAWAVKQTEGPDVKIDV